MVLPETGRRQLGAKLGEKDPPPPPPLPSQGTRHNAVCAPPTATEMASEQLEMMKEIHRHAEAMAGARRSATPAVPASVPSNQGIFSEENIGMLMKLKELFKL